MKCPLCGYSTDEFGEATIINQLGEEITICANCHRSIHFLCDRNPA